MKMEHLLPKHPPFPPPFSLPLQNSFLLANGNSYQPFHGARQHSPRRCRQRALPPHRGGLPGPLAHPQLYPHRGHAGRKYPFQLPFRPHGLPLPRNQLPASRSRLPQRHPQPPSPHQRANGGRAAENNRRKCTVHRGVHRCAMPNRHPVRTKREAPPKTHPPRAAPRL